MVEAKASKIINVPADQVWDTVREFSGLERYFSVFVSSTTEGSGVGAMRTLNLPDGGQFHERLNALDEKARTLTYVILQSPLPIENYVGTVAVEDAGKGQSRVTWSSTFSAPADQEPAIAAMFSDAYAGGIDGLENMHK